MWTEANVASTLEPQLLTNYISNIHLYNYLLVVTKIRIIIDIGTKKLECSQSAPAYAFVGIISFAAAIFRPHCALWPGQAVRCARKRKTDLLVPERLYSTMSISTFCGLNI